MCNDARSMSTCVFVAEGIWFDLVNGRRNLSILPIAWFRHSLTDLQYSGEQWTWIILTFYSPSKWRIFLLRGQIILIQKNEGKLMTDYCLSSTLHGKWCLSVCTQLGLISSIRKWDKVDPIWWSAGMCIWCPVDFTRKDFKHVKGNQKLNHQNPTEWRGPFLARLLLMCCVHHLTKTIRFVNSHCDSPKRCLLKVLTNSFWSPKTFFLIGPEKWTSLAKMDH